MSRRKVSESDRLGYVIMVRFPNKLRAVVEQAAKESGYETASEWVRSRCMFDVERIMNASAKPEYEEEPF